MQVFSEYVSIKDQSINLLADMHIVAQGALLSSFSRRERGNINTSHALVLVHKARLHSGFYNQYTQYVVGLDSEHNSREDATRTGFDHASVTSCALFHLSALSPAKDRHRRPFAQVHPGPRNARSTAKSDVGARNRACQRQ